MRVDLFHSPHVIAFRHPLVCGKPLHQWGVYCRHRRHRGEIEWGVILNGAASGVRLDYDGTCLSRACGPEDK